MKDYRGELEKKIISDFALFTDTYGFNDSLELLRTLELQREVIIREKTLRAAL